MRHYGSRSLENRMMKQSENKEKVWYNNKVENLDMDILA